MKVFSFVVIGNVCERNFTNDYDAIYTSYCADLNATVHLKKSNYAFFGGKSGVFCLFLKITMKQYWKVDFSPLSKYTNEFLSQSPQSRT